MRDTWTWIITICVLVCHHGRTWGMEEISMGTTIIALKYKDGCIMGADTRTSVSGYVSNRLASKLTSVWDDSHDVHMVRSNQNRTCCCSIGRSGSAADTQYLADAVRLELLSRRTRLHHNYNVLSISTIARILQRMIRHDEKHYQASLICAGYDGRGVIYSILPGGSCFSEQHWAIAGSGSSYITAFLTHQYQPNMSEQEATLLVQQALTHAMERDGSSGGILRIHIFDSKGKRELTFQPSSSNSSSSPRNSKLFAPPIRTRSKT